MVALDAVPAIVSAADRLHVFVRASDGVLLSLERSEDVWSPPVPVIASDASAPAKLVGNASAIAADGRIEVFFRMPLAGNLLHAVRDASGWRVGDLGGLVGRIAEH